MPIPDALPPEQIAAIMARHKPKNWRVVQSKRKTAEADRDDWMGRGDGKRIIRVPYVVCTWSLSMFLHECAHVNLGHWGDRGTMPTHVEEYEAERYALFTLLAEGIHIPKWRIDNGKTYVKSHVNADIAKGISIDAKVAKWIRSKVL